MLSRFRVSSVIFLFLLMSFPVSSHAVDKKTAFRIEKAIKEFHQEIINTRRYIHMNPELGNREYETAKLIASKLIALGFEVETGVAKTGIVGLLRGNQAGITAGIRADMDALPIQELTGVPYQSLNPGVMHACGHDFHTAVVLGTAMVMSHIKDQLKGNIKFIFQPAEEGPPKGEEGGASLMIEEGILENPSVQAIFGFHVWPENVGKAFFSKGFMMASSDSFEIVIKGKSSHGARPHEGIDAISLAAQTVVSIQSIISRTVDPTNPAVVSIGKIHGGIRSNIIAEEVRLEGTIRTLDAINRDRIGQQIENIVKGITHAFNADYTFSLSKGAPPVYNHPEFAEIMLPSLYDVLGRENVSEIAPQMVAEDFSYFGQKIPGFYFFLGVKDPQQVNMAPLHSPYFNPDERSIPLGIKIMSHLLLDCLDYHSRLDRNFP